MRKRRRTRTSRLCRAAVAVAMPIWAAACSGDGDNQDGTRSESPDTTVATEPQDSAPPAMADGAILDVALTANTMEVQVSELAQFRAQDTDIRRFAQTMVPDHRAVNGELQLLAGRASLAPITDEQSNALRTAAITEFAALDSLYGAAFDQAYIEREVEYHEKLVELFDQTLIPAAQNEQLKTLLERVRPMLAAHLERARQIRAARAR